MIAITRNDRVGMSCGMVLILTGVASLQYSYGQQKSELSEHYVLDKIRIFYATDGISAVPLADLDSTGIPDHVEDVAKQVWAAKRLFCDVLGFPDPLTSERYPGVTCIQVFLRERAEIGGLNGVAFDEAQRARPIPEGRPDDRAIVIAVGCHVVAAKNVTPAHELFHLIQYGATYFKKGWFLEGQARWSEHALFEGGLGDVKYSPRGPWPQPTTNLPTLFAMSADSEFVLWNPIAMGADPKGLLAQTPELRELAELRYSDGSPVLRDLYLAGADPCARSSSNLERLMTWLSKNLGMQTGAKPIRRLQRTTPTSTRQSWMLSVVVLRRSGDSREQSRPWLLRDELRQRRGIEVRNERMQKRMPPRVSTWMRQRQRRAMRANGGSGRPATESTKWRRSS